MENIPPSNEPAPSHGPQAILPDNTRATALTLASAAALQEPAKSLVATKSFHEAVSACKDKVAKIVRECRRFNRKFRDAHFDLGLNQNNCIHGLLEPGELKPATSARVAEVFEEPKFFKDGATAGDIQQGEQGDCWFLAAIATVSNISGLIEKICVARDEVAGVYGFVFLRDGEWCSVVIDDQLFLRSQRFHDATQKLQDLFQEEEYNKAFVNGSRALLAARCEDPNETWLPLLEKAYAKIHGDYGSIDGGYTGEAVEDLTGGVTTELFTADILDTDAFWREELSRVNHDFLFAAWIPTPIGRKEEDRQGVIKGHAYSVLRAVEAKGKRLVLLRNPWGKKEWQGSWSDGSKEWDAEWIAILGHRFGDDGQFWMTYQDFLRKYTIIDRTRLFDDTWNVSEPRWINYRVPWSADYAMTKFKITVTKETSVVIVLSQLDGRYFRGLEGRYTFSLRFRVHQEGEEDYLIRSHPNVLMNRSVSAELNLDPGVYTVQFSAEAALDPESQTTKQVVSRNKHICRKKFRQIAMNADLAHAKAGSMSFWREADEELTQEYFSRPRSPQPVPPGPHFGRPMPSRRPRIEERIDDFDPDQGDRMDGDRRNVVIIRSRSHSPVREERRIIREEPRRMMMRVMFDDPTWEARVCLGLKVYSKDEELTVEVVKEAQGEPVDLDEPARDVVPVNTRGGERSDVEAPRTNEHELQKRESRKHEEGNEESGWSDADNKAEKKAEPVSPAEGRVCKDEGGGDKTVESASPTEGGACKDKCGEDKMPGPTSPVEDGVRKNEGGGGGVAGPASPVEGGRHRDEGGEDKMTGPASPAEEVVRKGEGREDKIAELASPAEDGRHKDQSGDR